MLLLSLLPQIRRRGAPQDVRHRKAGKKREGSQSQIHGETSTH